MTVRILYLIAIAIFSTLIIAFAYDLSAGNEIPISGTKEDTQGVLIFLAKTLGITGSWIVGILFTGISLYSTVQAFRNRKKV